MIKKGLLLGLGVSFLMVLPYSYAQTPTAKTLPKGVWKFGVQNLDFDVSRVTVKDQTDSNSPLEIVKTNEFAVRNSTKLVSSYTEFGGSINPNNPINLDTKLANSVEFNYTYFDIGYGITDKLTVGLRLRYVDKRINYTDAYQTMITNTITAIDTIYGAGTAKAGGTYQIPDQAKGSGIGDTDLNIKYRWTDTFSTALVMRAGILKTGTDPKEKAAKRDNFEALSTGKAEDIYSLYLMKDYKVNDRLDFTFLGGYTYITQGYEKVLDFDGRTDQGDELLLLANANLHINDQFYISPSITWFATGADKQYVNDRWETIPNSEVRQLFGKIQLNYTPYVFTHLFVAYERTLDANRTNGFYNVPGRLIADDYYSAGITLYLK